MNIETKNFMRKVNANGCGVLFEQRNKILKYLTKEIYGYDFNFNKATLGNAFSLPKHLFFLDKFAFKDHMYYMYWDASAMGVGYISEDTYDFPKEVLDYFETIKEDRVNKLFIFFEETKIK